LDRGDRTCGAFFFDRPDTGKANGIEGLVPILISRDLHTINSPAPAFTYKLHQLNGFGIRWQIRRRVPKPVPALIDLTAMIGTPVDLQGKIP
jgi:hypothetical protein